jgi:lysine N-acyltransferase
MGIDHGVRVTREPYAIRLAGPDSDAELVSEWMNRPHLAEAWEYDWPLAGPGRRRLGQFTGTFEVRYHMR